MDANTQFEQSGAMNNMDTSTVSLTILLLIVTGAGASKHADLTAGPAMMSPKTMAPMEYWQAVLPETPMPQAIHDLLTQSTGVLFHKYQQLIQGDDSRMVTASYGSQDDGHLRKITMSYGSQGEEDSRKVTTSYGSQGDEESKKVTSSYGLTFQDEKDSRKVTTAYRSQSEDSRKVTTSYESQGEENSRKVIVPSGSQDDGHSRKIITMSYVSQGEDDSRKVTTSYGSQGDEESRKVTTSYGSQGEKDTKKVTTSYRSQGEDPRKATTSYGSKGKEISRKITTTYVSQDDGHSRKVTISYGSQGEEDSRKVTTSYRSQGDDKSRKVTTSYGSQGMVTRSYGSQDDGDSMKLTMSYGSPCNDNSRKVTTSYVSQGDEKSRKVTTSYGSQDEKDSRMVTTSYGSQGENSRKVTTSYGSISQDDDGPSRKITMPYVSKGEEEDSRKVTTSYGSQGDEEPRKLATSYGSQGEKDSRKASTLYRSQGDMHDHIHSHNDGNQLADVFFFHDVLRPGSTITPIIPLTTSLPSLLSRREADSIPFSTKRFGEILDMFPPASHTMADEIQWTLDTCEHPQPLPGEKAGCATSLESLAKLPAALLGTRNVRAFSGDMPIDPAGTTARRGRYEVTEVRKLSDSPIVAACHDLTYPYAVYYCHTTNPAAAYLVTLAAEDGGAPTAMEALAVCHLDTSPWTPRHPFLVAHNLKPGDVAVCHFLSKLSIVWVPAGEQGGAQAM